MAGGLGSIALLTGLFGGLGVGLFFGGWGVVFVVPSPATPPSVASISTVVSRHCPPPAWRSGEVPVEHQWSGWGASWFLCEQRV